jgi:hypothetical protein
LSITSVKYHSSGYTLRWLIEQEITANTTLADRHQPTAVIYRIGFISGWFDAIWHWRYRIVTHIKSTTNTDHYRFLSLRVMARYL